MIALSEFKILLGPDAAALSDNEVEQIRMEMYQLADLAFESWKDSHDVV